MPATMPASDPHPLGASFRRFARASAHALGSPVAFFLAVTTIVVRGVSGPFFHYSETWQLVINTGTTIVTFLMVFLIQNSQNRESAATQIKLDELIRAVEQARNSIIDVEEQADEEVDAIQQDFFKLGAAAHALGEAARAGHDAATSSSSSGQHVAVERSDSAPSRLPASTPPDSNSSGPAVAR